MSMAIQHPSYRENLECPRPTHGTSAVAPYEPPAEQSSNGSPVRLLGSVDRMASSGHRTGSLLEHLTAQRRLDHARENRFRFCKYVLVSAFHSLALVLGNATISIGLSWLAALSYTTGNIFSGSSPLNQSNRTFLVGTLLWAHLWFGFAVFAGCSSTLFRLELISHPGRPAGVMRVVAKLFRRTLLWFLFSGGIVASIGYGLGSVDASYRKYRLELYASTIWIYSYMPFADQATRKIYRNETVQGRGRRQLQQEQQRISQNQTQMTRSTRSPRRRLLANASLFISMLVPILYVHAISFGGAISSTQFVRLFTLASLVFKVVMQEVTKFYIIRNKIQNARAMAILVAIPTMLIDTQVRIVLLRFQDATTTMSTSVAIALSEFVVRVSKALLVKFQMERRRRQRTTSTGFPATQELTPAEASSHGKVVDTDFELWRAQLHRYHAIEVSADMYAEYLAIGCSSAIMAMLGPHSQYLLTASYTTTSDSDSNAGSTMTSSPVSIHGQLLTQVAMEVVVDLASCAVEICSGLPFAQVDRERGYFLVLCVTLALLNVSISAILYLAY